MMQKKVAATQPEPAPVAVVVTVRNEAETIWSLLAALQAQTILAREVIVVDGGSHDQTLAELARFAATYPDFPLRYTAGHWTRSQGRNLAIKMANSPLIAITDAGCLPVAHWLAELLAGYYAGQQAKQSAEVVVAGYAHGVAETGWQAAVLPYLLVMPDRVQPEAYLPATRSVLLPKSVWSAVGGFDESLATSEDFILAQRIKAAGYPIVFRPQAAVSWSPPRSWWPLARTFFTFAAADVQAGIWRPQVVLLLARYLLAVLLLTTLSIFNQPLTSAVALLGLGGYLVWAVAKNRRYAPRSWYWLPVLQLTADLTVLAGSSWGWLCRFAFFRRGRFHP